jgi:hypothetical protein
MLRKTISISMRLQVSFGARICFGDELTLSRTKLIPRARDGVSEGVLGLQKDHLGISGRPRRKVEQSEVGRRVRWSFPLLSFGDGGNCSLKVLATLA